MILSVRKGLTSKINSRVRQIDHFSRPRKTEAGHRPFEIAEDLQIILGCSTQTPSPLKHVV